MADTPRTYAALQSIFADNTTGDISPQDLRDFATSWACNGSIGRGEATATISVTNTVYSTMVFTTNVAAVNTVASATDGNLTLLYPGLYHINYTVAFAGTASKLFEFALFVGETETDLGLFRKLGAAGDVGSAGFVGCYSASATATLSVRCQSPDGGTQVRVNFMHLTAQKIG